MYVCMHDYIAVSTRTSMYIVERLCEDVRLYNLMAKATAPPEDCAPSTALVLKPYQRHFR